MRYNAQMISYSTSISSAKDLSIVLRQSTVGPELDIVYHFYEEHLKEFVSDSNLAVFVEPRLDSGFPDMVVAFWDREVSNRWSFKRKQLLRSDMLIVHHVNLTKSLPINSLIERMGAKKAKDAIYRLEEANIVDVTSDTLLSKPLEEIYAINRLIAIEAKVKDWRKGMEQAFRNTWFASESYLLLGSIPQSHVMLEEAAKLGVGILDNKRSLIDPYAPSKLGDLPASYASWLFNEWVWKHDLLKGK